MLIESAPGTNVLDAYAQLTAGQEPKARSALVCAAYFALLDYLPPHVELLAHWSDAETAERVAGKLRQLAATTRKGGPAEVPILPPPSDEVLEHATGRNKLGAAKHTHKPGGPRPPGSPLALLRHEAGVLEGALTRARRAKHPDVAKQTENTLRLEAVQREIRELEEAEKAEADAEVDGDARALELIAESQRFPADRDPSRNGRPAATSRSGL